MDARDFEQAQHSILQWMQQFLEVSNPALDGWAPCPYARAARLRGSIDFRAGGADPYVDLRHITHMGGFEVVVLIYEVQEFGAQEFNDLVSAANLAFLSGHGLIALADHPGDREEVRGVCMNQGQWALVLVQDQDRLDQAARQLAQRGFYDGWPEDYLQTLFQGRPDPRS